MHVTINGERRELPAGNTVSQLVELLGLKGRAVAVEVNKQLVPKKQHEGKEISEGDVIEVVSLVGGG
ncbi:MAG: sulfur carrier protein ThiS [Phycisphaeraceae bacterium]